MIWNYHGKQIPLETYHGVPKGWYADEIVAEHKFLGGTFNLGGPVATEPGAPSWMPERFQWLQYREMLYRLRNGIRAGDLACVELAIRYIELRHIGSYSGYVRSKLCRCLKHASLSHGHKSRLHSHFLKLVEDGERTQEFCDYLKLWKKFISEEEKRDAFARLKRAPFGTAKATWLAQQFKFDPVSKSSC